MNREPDGQPFRYEPVAFTRYAASRISRAVRIVEAGDRKQAGLKYARPPQDSKVLKIGTFTGSWDVATYKTVTLSGSTTTVSVYNWTTPVVVPTTESHCTRMVMFGRAAGRPSAVEIQLDATCQTCLLSFGNVDLTALPGYADDEIQLLGHNKSACLQWYSIVNCSTSAE